MLQHNFDTDYQVTESLPPTSAAPERAQQPTVDVREMARILRRRWKAIAAPVLVFLALSVIYL